MANTISGQVARRLKGYLLWKVGEALGIQCFTEVKSGPCS